MKEVNLDCLLKRKKIQARLEVKAIDTCPSKISDDINQETKTAASIDAEPKVGQENKETTRLDSEDGNKIKNSSPVKHDISQKAKKLVPCDKKTGISETCQDQISSRKVRNLKEVENLRNPKEISETSSDKSEVEISQISKSTSSCKKIKKAGTKKSKEVSCDNSEIPDPDIKEVKENVPKPVNSKAVGKIKSLQSSLSQNKKDQSGKQESNVDKEQKVEKESKSKDKDLLKTDSSKKKLQIKIGKRGNSCKTEKKGRKLVKVKESSSKEKKIKNPDGKTDAGKKRDIKKQSKSSSRSKNNIEDPKKGSIDISKSNNIVDEENRKKQKVLSKKGETKLKDLSKSKSAPNDVSKENVQKKTASISQLVKVTPVKSETKSEEFRKKIMAKSKISKDTVKTKQTILQFKSFDFAGENKEKSILKESRTPSNKRKLSVSFDKQPTEEKAEETELLNDCKEAETPFNQTSKRRKIKSDCELDVPLKDTEAVMKINAGTVDIENENDLDQKEKSVDTLKTPLVSL